MSDVYRTRFHLGNEHGKPSFGQVVQLVTRSVGERTKLAIEENLEGKLSFENEKNKVLTIGTTKENRRLYGLRWTNCASNVCWTVDFGLCESQGEDPLVEITLSRDISKDKIAPTKTTPSTPIIVSQLINNFGARAFGKLSTRPFRVNQDNLGKFLNFLKDTRRDLPLVFISKDNRNNSYIANPQKIARRLVGISYVFAEEDKSVNMALKEALGELRCFDGAVRLYWPFSEGDLEVYHPLWTREKQSELRDLSFDLFQKISKLSVVRTRTLDYDIISRVLTEKEIDDLRKSLAERKSYEDYEKLVTLLEDENKDLRGIAERKDSQIQSLAENNELLKRQIESLRLANVELQKQISSTKKPAPLEVQVIEPRSMQEAYEQYLKQYSESERRVIVHSRAERHIRSSQYREPMTFLNLLLWLENTFIPARRGEISIPDLNASCLAATGMTFAPHQSEITMGQYPHEYKISFDGKTYLLEEHFKKGTGRDQTQNLRVAGCTLEDKRFLIGYVGTHQRNRKS